MMGNVFRCFLAPPSGRLDFVGFVSKRLHVSHVLSFFFFCSHQRGRR